MTLLARRKNVSTLESSAKRLVAFAAEKRNIDSVANESLASSTVYLEGQIPADSLWSEKVLQEKQQALQIKTDAQYDFELPYPASSLEDLKIHFGLQEFEFSCNLQRQVLPIALRGFDVCVRVPSTFLPNTSLYAIVAIEVVLRQKIFQNKPMLFSPFVLVVVSQAEEVDEVTKSIEQVSPKFVAVRSSSTLESIVDIFVSTTQQLVQLSDPGNSKVLQLSNVKLFVVDDANRVDWTGSLLRRCLVNSIAFALPRPVQTIAVTAESTREDIKLIEDITRPKWRVKLSNEKSESSISFPPNLSHRLHTVPNDECFPKTLKDILNVNRRHYRGPFVVYCNSAKDVDDIWKFLTNTFPTLKIHKLYSKLDSTEKWQVLQAYRTEPESSNSVFVTTDILSSDNESTRVVINVNRPIPEAWNRQDYHYRANKISKPDGLIFTILNEKDEETFCSQLRDAGVQKQDIVPLRFMDDESI